MKKKYLYNIELLRFIFAWAVVFFYIVYKNHFDKFGFAPLKDYFKYGEEAVDYFFIISGYWLWVNFDESQHIINFVKNKYIRFTPTLIFSTTLFYIFHKMGYWSFNLSANIETILLIRDWSSTWRLGTAVHTAWFLSELLLLSVFIFSIRKAIKDEKIVLLIIGILMFIGWRLHILPHSDGRYGILLGHPKIGRGMFDMGLGIWVALLSNELKNKSSNNVYLWTGIEFSMLFFIIQRLFNGKHSHIDHLLSIICFSLLFLSFVEKRGFIARISDIKISSILGRYSFGIYLNHIFVLDLCRRIVFPYYSVTNVLLGMIIIIIFTMLLSIFSYHCIEKPILKRKNNVK